MKLKRRDFIILGSLGTLGGITLSYRIPFSPQEMVESEKVIATSPPPLLRLIAVADTGTGAKGQYAVAQAMTRYHQENPFNVAILAGDNIYNHGEITKIKQVFEEPYRELLQAGVKFHACLGNHDIITDNGEPQVAYPGFNMGGRYYTFNYDPVQFFALDTNENADWDKQLVWLEQELSQSQSPWKIVFGHHNLYSSGVYGVNQALIKLLTPLLEKYNVQLYINGHEHHYERTGAIAGTTYLTCGAGAGSRPVGRSSWTQFSTSQLSFATLEVYENKIMIQGINTENKVFDRGTISLK